MPIFWAIRWTKFINFRKGQESWLSTQLSNYDSEVLFGEALSAMSKISLASGDAPLYFQAWVSADSIPLEVFPSLQCPQCHFEDPHGKCACHTFFALLFRLILCTYVTLYFGFNSRVVTAHFKFRDFPHWTKQLSEVVKGVYCTYTKGCFFSAPSLNC